MTVEIALTLGILFAAVVLFVTEIVRADLVALLVLVALAASGLVTPEESISGFSNPAVVTIWAVFILSAGLARTGVASMIGRIILRLAGKGINRLIAVLMGGTASLSGFMNNTGVAAMFLPVTIDIARRTGRPASLLLMPMAYGSLLGGMLVLIGTSTNLVVSDFLRDAGFSPPGLFDFTPVGAVIFAAAVLYMITAGQRLLPLRQSSRPFPGSGPGHDIREHYGLHERLSVLVVPDNSPLSDKTLAQSRLGETLGINVISVKRRNGLRLDPRPDLRIAPGDRMLILGKLDLIDELTGRPLIVPGDDTPDPSSLVSEKVGLAELLVTEDSVFNGKTIVGLDARRALGVNLLAVRRRDVTRRTNLGNIVFEPGDRMLVQGSIENLEAISDHPGFRRLSAQDTGDYMLHERLLFARIPEGSPLGGDRIKDLSLSSGYGISVLSIIRAGEKILMPDPSIKLEDNDLLILGGRPVDIEVLRGHQTLIIDRHPSVNLDEVEAGEISMVEVMLSPYTTLAGKTLKQLSFREKYGVSVLSVWRRDRSYRTGLSGFPLEFGDALLCVGTRDKFELLARERDFVVLNLDVQEKPNLKKAPVSGMIMAGVVAAVLLNWLPIYVAAIAGAAFMVLTRCLTMGEAYRSIEWKAVFLIAAMLPMGLSMQKTGAASLIAGVIIDAAGNLGPSAVLAGIMVLAMIINQLIPSTVNAVVMAPIAMAAASGMGVSPYPLIMGVAYAVAASFMSPLSHPANVMIMSPGGYRFSDFIKNGLPLSIIVLVVCILMIPVIFPF